MNFLISIGGVLKNKYIIAGIKKMQQKRKMYIDVKKKNIEHSFDIQFYCGFRAVFTEIDSSKCKRCE